MTCALELNYTRVLQSICISSFKKIILLAALDLSLSTRDLHCIMWDLLMHRTDSLVVACGLSCSVAFGILVP